MTESGFRRLALALPGAEERQHMNHPDFRVVGKIFATMGYPRRGCAMIKLTPADQLAFTSIDPDAFVPVKGAWGERGCTNVILEAAAVGPVKAALRAAYDALLAARPAKATRCRRARTA